MDRRRLLLLSAAALALCLSAGPAHAAISGSSGGENEVELTGEETRGETATGEDDSEGDEGESADAPQEASDSCATPAPLCPQFEQYSATPLGQVPGVAALTIRDLAAFRPQAPAGRSQPDGWAVVGLPANFLAEAAPHIVAGTLLGRPAEVRFTPVGFSWQFSDGAVVRSGTSGESWASLGQREFTDTATSHRFAQRGRATVQLTVTYAAEFRFDGSAWVPVTGTVDAVGAVQAVVVGALDTVLTDGDCLDSPRGPGC